MDEGIRYATELGMYVVLDWHILSDGNPKTSQKQAFQFLPGMQKSMGNKIIYYTRYVMSQTEM